MINLTLVYKIVCIYTYCARNVKNLSHTFICHTLYVFVYVYLYIHMHLDHMVHPAMMCFGKVENECKQLWCWPEAMQSPIETNI